ncbi:MAG: response regulator, partial [Chloroflexi bacterium]|nr:response regulator [Chloroflexota bacterium]
MNNLRALIIEDEADLAEIYTKALQREGFETDTIKDGRKAIERLSTVSPNVILLDLHLPQVGGAAILQAIRSDERLKKTPVIVTTADERQAEELEHKADLVLLKPVSLNQLRELANRM